MALSAHNNSVVFSADIQQAQAYGNRLLGAISFDATITPKKPEMGTEMPCIQVSMPLLSQSISSCEVWLSTGSVSSGRFGEVRYRHDGETLFGVIELAQLPGSAETLPLQQATESAYRQIFALLDKERFPHVYRFWNYMPDINGFNHGLERYHLFNIGRQDAFLSSGREVAGSLPAACALGTRNGPLAIAFIAGHTPTLAIENPRQIRAYQYPEQYGPRSPTFSRASLLRHAHEDILLVSGTASIIGHETLHVGDVLAQTRETLTNLQAVAMEANRLIDQVKFSLKNMCYRVYVRHASDMPTIRDEMQRVIKGELQATFIQADICRQDLLLEIEASATSLTSTTEQPTP
ncbi:MAG: hypothetical protein Q8J65_05860 [Nitrosomonadales bacterium]|nr:hypothetical protein [Nitrosomonadales bacterium]